MANKHLNLSKPHRFCRIIDGLIALCMLGILAVALIPLGLYRLTKHRPVFETINLVDGSKAQRSVHRLAGDNWLARLSEFSWVFSAKLAVLGGDICFQSPSSAHYPSWPGVVSLADVEQRIGLGWLNRHERLSALHRSPMRYLAALCRALITLLIVPTPRLGERKVRLLGIDIDNLSMAQLLDLLMKHAHRRQARHFAFVNTDCLNRAYLDTEYRAVLATCDGVFGDGIGVRLGCHITHQGLKDNLNGTDLFPLLCERAASQGRSIYLLGGNIGIADAAANAMKRRYPTLNIAGCHHGFIDESDPTQLISDINHSGADILLVGMGAPRQELWLANHRRKLNVGVALGVGGLFDFYSGRIPRSPLWFRQLGLEWCWRLAQEPSRMWRRYLLGNPLFLLRVIRERRRLESASVRSSLASFTPAWLDGDTADKKLRQKHQLRLLSGRIVKRCLDVIASSLALLLLLPVFLLVALAIRLESQGPVLYRQIRAGENNEPFSMWKFRSMYMDAEARLTALTANNDMKGGVLFKMREDPRITRVGRVIRKASIDELPQLWNVLKGDMSLVGPRPALPREVALYPNHARQRLAIKPGITCIWQVSGRSELPFDDQIALDLEYIHTQSLWADLCLLVKTIPAVLSARGAY